MNGVVPGPFETDRICALGRLLEEMRKTIPVGRVGQPREMGDLVAFLASERAGFIKRTTIAMDGGQVRALP